MQIIDIVIIFAGLSLAPLLRYAAYVDPSLIPTAFLGASVIFGGFSLAALFSRERTWLYLGGKSCFVFPRCNVQWSLKQCFLFTVHLTFMRQRFILFHEHMGFSLSRLNGYQLFIVTIPSLFRNSDVYPGLDVIGFAAEHLSTQPVTVSGKNKT